LKRKAVIENIFVQEQVLLFIQTFHNNFWMLWSWHHWFKLCHHSFFVKFEFLNFKTTFVNLISYYKCLYPMQLILTFPITKKHLVVTTLPCLPQIITLDFASPFMFVVPKRIANDNFGFFLILHYYNCSGLLYANI
jgi:hypothetical protein